MNQFIFLSELYVLNLWDTWDTWWNSTFENILTASDERQTDRRTRDLFFFLIIIAGRRGGCSQILIWEIFLQIQNYCPHQRWMHWRELDWISLAFGKSYFGYGHMVYMAILYHSFSREGEIRFNTVTHSHLGHIFQSHLQFGRCGGRATEKKKGLSYSWRRSSLNHTITQ